MNEPQVSPLVLALRENFGRDDKLLFIPLKPHKTQLEWGIRRELPDAAKGKREVLRVTL